MRCSSRLRFFRLAISSACRSAHPIPGIVAHVGRLLGKLPPGTELVIDFTGVGRPVFDMFVYSGISPLGRADHCRDIRDRATGRSAACRS